MFKSSLLLVVCVALTGCIESIHYNPHGHRRSRPARREVVVERHEVVHESPVHAPHRREKLVYCKQCGVIAGRSSNCPRRISHDIISVPAGLKVLCKRCGAYPATVPTNCPHHISHDFMTVRHGVSLICDQCGGAPTGKPVSCKMRISHDYKMFR